ncbi:hypothetical protein IV203_021208 [Nitzschia inconspicua]|uniref:Uncharacterized protein n=1 Tax=Nitzschia inconspicua TaxID=303405 RepID=A0A9K3KI45_9STRA|nr:hypothetical protein IV203_021208 [Nitzschia inconspicua]
MLCTNCPSSRKGSAAATASVVLWLCLPVLSFVPSNNAARSSGHHFGCYVSPTTAFAPQTASKSQRIQHHPSGRQQHWRLETFQGFQQPYNVTTLVEDNEDDDGNFNLALEEEETAIMSTFAYGTDSTCYRGLTKPSQAAVVLTVLLSAGMVATSPALDLSSLPALLLDGSSLSLDTFFQDATVTSILDRLSFEWEMSSLLSSFQQLSDQMGPVMEQQQHVWQDTVSAFSTQSQDWIVQVASQLADVQDVAAEKWASLQGTANDLLLRCTEAATEKTSLWQVAGQSLLNDCQRELAQFSGQARAQYAMIEGMSKTAIDDVGEIASHMKAEASRLLGQYGEIAAEKYRDVVSVAQTEMRQMGQMASQIQDDSSRILSQYGSIASEKYANVQRIAQDDTDRVARILNGWQQDASIGIDRYSDFVAEKYMGLEQAMMGHISKLQDQLVVVSQQMQDRTDEMSTLGQKNAASKWAEIQPMIEAFSREMQHSMVDFTDQSKNSFTAISRQLQVESNTVSAQGKDFLGHQFAELKQIGVELLRFTKTQYLQNYENALAYSNHILEDSTVKARQLGDDFVPAIQSTQRLLSQSVDYTNDAFASFSSSLFNQAPSLADGAASTTQSLKYEYASQLVGLKDSATSKIIETKPATVPSLESDLLKDTLRSMLD